MTHHKIAVAALCTGLLGSLPGLALAQAAAGCAAYPYTDGVNVEDVQGGTKILATASASVSFDDIDSVRDARTEATLEAKAMISRFMTEDIQSDQAVNKVVNETKTMSGQQKQALRREVIERITRLRSSSQALLRGVVVLGECYTKGEELRVSVGIKPETIAQAGNLASGIGRSVAADPTPRSGGNAGRPAGQAAPAPGNADGSRPLQPVEGYSNTERLKTF